ncbi:ATP-dependent RecD-like DNA helicase [Acidithiobacillus sp. M4-SHS-6]|uniref:ATP-dependent DNA helicase n=1 Tax=Acidithiobacillus sp. M4-SHS-6 TaxID=3383024 RepID=UPI0039BDA720
MSATIIDLQKHRRNKAPVQSVRETPKLTSGQKKVYQGILDAIHHKSHRGALLQGYAGCGKTYVAAKIIHQLQEEGRRIAVTAPTHKALRVLTQTLAKQCEEMPETMTVHALLGMRLVRFHDGTQSLQQSSDHNKIRDFNVVIVDECSMINALFFHKLMETRAFLLFLGDPAQLPPVGNHQPSPVFQDRRLLRFTLNEVVRQNRNSPILQLAHDIRIQNGTPFPIHKLHDYSDAESLQVFTKDQFQYDWDQKNQNIRILAWRNQSVDQYNGLLHSTLFPSERMPYTAGERIVLQERTITESRGQRIELSNGSEGIIQSVQECTHPDWPSIAAWKMQVIMDSAIFDNDEDTDIRHFAQRVPVTLWVPKEMPRVRAQAEQYFRQYTQESRKKNEQMALEYSRLGWKLRDDFANIKQAYSSTVHKSQGSTYDTAIVDIADLAHPKARADFNRLLYTAITRPKHKLLLIV